MATVDEYLDQFEHNLRVSHLLADAGDNWDWAVTALFYAALHLCQAYVRTQGLTIESHRARQREMLKSQEFRPILDHYKALQNDSEEARYDCRRFSRAEYESIRDGVFPQITTHLHTF